MRTAASEQVVFAKAMVPTMRSTTTLLAATVRGAKTLEHAITALSNQFTVSATNSSAHSQGSPDRMSVISEVTVPSELGMTEHLVTCAEEVVLNHRRKQAILLGIIMTFQLSCRSRYFLSKLIKTASSNEPQTTSNDSATLRASREFFAATTIQTCARGCRARLYYRRARSSASSMQAHWRARRSRFAFTLVREAIIRAQRFCRGYLARSRLTIMVHGRLALYRRHLVLLWKRTNTSLCYRSVFWSLVRKENLLQLAFVEEEISRLWGELAMSPPKFAKELDDPWLSDEARLRIYVALNLNPGEAEEAVLKATAHLRATCKQYVQVLTVGQRTSHEFTVINLARWQPSHRIALSCTNKTSRVESLLLVAQPSLSVAASGIT